MKKLMITGASGFLGSRTAEYYSRNYQVFAPSHREMDITDIQSVERYMKENMPDAAVHCAAVSDVGLCGREPERSRQINVTGSENIARVCRQIGAKCILCSSDQVYFGSREPGPHREDEALKPGNEYGRQKLFLEKSCLEINPDSVLLRLSWMYDAVGKNEKEHGDFLRTLHANKKEGAEMYYPVYDVRGITDVSEVIANLKQALSLPGGIYNFGSGNEKNTYQLVKELFSRMQWDDKMLKENREAFADCPRDISMDMSKIRRFGIGFSDTLERLCRIS